MWKKNYDKIKNIKKIIYADLNSKKRYHSRTQEDVVQALVFGAGSTGTSLMDLYVQTVKHNDVLQILEQRFPKELEDYGVIEWFNKIETLMQKGEQSVNAYISAFKGMAAEELATEFLQSQGYKVKVFDSLIHKDTDLLVKMGNGKNVDFSVKCGDVDYIKQCISKSDATHYVINSEAYSGLCSSGMLQEYNAKGIEILDGGYFDHELSEQAANAFEDIHEAGNVGDHLPYIAIALLCIKTYKNINQYTSGHQSEYELGVNLVTDVARVGMAGGFAFVGGELGSMLGTMLTPGIGTIIGGGIGVVAGALAGSTLLTKINERLKWGKIIDAIDYFGIKHSKKFTKEMQQSLMNHYFKCHELDKQIREERERLKTYRKLWLPAAWQKVTLQSVLVEESYKNLIRARKRIDYTGRQIHQEIMAVCTRVAAQIAPNREFKQQEIRNRYLGELIVANRVKFGIYEANENEYNLISGYEDQIESAPNHPYRFNVSSQDVLGSIIYGTYKKIDEEAWRMKIRSKYIGAGLAICILLVVLSKGFLTATTETNSANVYESVNYGQESKNPMFSDEATQEVIIENENSDADTEIIEEAIEATQVADEIEEVAAEPEVLSIQILNAGELQGLMVGDRFKVNVHVETSQPTETVPSMLYSVSNDNIMIDQGGYGEVKAQGTTDLSVQCGDKVETISIGINKNPIMDMQVSGLELNATIASGIYELTWEEIEGADSYRVTWRTDRHKEGILEGSAVVETNEAKFNLLPSDTCTIWVEALSHEVPSIKSEPYDFWGEINEIGFSFTEIDQNNNMAYCSWTRVPQAEAYHIYIRKCRKGGPNEMDYTLYKTINDLNATDLIITGEDGEFGYVYVSAVLNGKEVAISTHREYNFYEQS